MHGVLTRCTLMACCCPDCSAHCDCCVLLNSLLYPPLCCCLSATHSQGPMHLRDLIRRCPAVMAEYELVDKYNYGMFIQPRSSRGA
jgi:hypothetical protein